MLDGKKKFTATITSLVVGFVGLLATNGVLSEETSSTVVQILTISLPIVLGIVYNVFQGWQDKKKEETKQIEAQKEQAIIQANSVTEPVKQYVQEKLAQPFDAQAFDEKVKAYTAARYGEVNEFTEFYTAKDLGKERNIDDINQAIDYWAYLYNKGNTAFVKKFGFGFADRFDRDNLTATLDNNTCVFPDINTMAVQKGVDYLAILREMERIEQKRADLDWIKSKNLDWTKLPNTSYYWVGEAAYLLFTQNK